MQGTGSKMKGMGSPASHSSSKRGSSTSARGGGFVDLKPYQDVLPLPAAYDLTSEPDETSRVITLKPASHNYAPTQLKDTTAWTYDGMLPGPTIVTRKAQTVHIRWHNTIDEKSTLPYQVLRFNDAGKDAVPPQNFPGGINSTVDPSGDPLKKAASHLTAATVTHLHGARVASDSDGWTENVSRFRHSQLTTYHDRPRSACLWYHDHALGVTRLNVYAGLFGFWLIRDDVEAGLIKDGTLPGGKDEVALVIQDRNLDMDAKNALDGRILHKTESSTAEMFGPYTAVNGVIWPQTDVGAGPVRFRLLNGSNARTFCLKLVRARFSTEECNDGGVVYTDDLSETVPMWQVGTDGGLLDFPVAPTSTAVPPPAAPRPGKPMTVPLETAPIDPIVNRGLILAPAERADLVIDFSALKPGDTVALVNTAFAPFHGSTVTFPYAFQPDGTLQLDANETGPAGAGSIDLNQRLTHAHVLLFNVKAPGPKLPGGKKPSPLTGTTPLDKNFQRYVISAGDAPGRNELIIPDNYTSRWIALSEFRPGKLYFRELQEVMPRFGTVSAFPVGSPPIISITGDDGTQRWFQTVAMAFHDALTIEAKFGGWEVWNIVNLTVDTHPIHVHLVEFQVLARIPVDASGYIDESGATVPGQPIDATKSSLPPRLLDSNEQGYKDTVRVNPGEIVRIAMKFDGFCGRFMYHCHILEHEDMDMMRPFIVVSPQAQAAMQANGMGGGGAMGGMKM